jgi:hypothetical protein
MFQRGNNDKVENIRERCRRNTTDRLTSRDRLKQKLCVLAKWLSVQQKIQDNNRSLTTTRD